MPLLPLGTVILPASNSSAPPPTSIATTVATHAQSTLSTTQVQPSYQLPQIQTSQQPQQPSQVQQPAQLGAQRLVQVHFLYEVKK